MLDFILNKYNKYETSLAGAQIKILQYLIISKLIQM